MKIPEWLSPSDQMAILGDYSWSVPRLFELSKDLPVMEIPLEHLNTAYYLEKLSLREMVMHMRAVEHADLNMPIILDEDGDVMDGRHRIMKALFYGKKTIKAVRFEVNPPPCRERQ